MSLNNGYWTLSSQRMRRRQVIAAAGALGTAAALGTVGCGGNGNQSGKGTSDSNSLLSKPEDTTAKAKAGGTYKTYTTLDIITFDVIATNTVFPYLAIGNYTYPRLLKFKTAKYPDFAEGDAEGDLAESFEVSADKLQITMKLRQGLKWDSRAPTSGREIDASDVVATFQRFAAISPNRTTLVYSAQSPAAPVESISAVDNRTIVIKLKQPNASTIQLLASSSLLSIMPREADGGFDPKGEVRGYGPWLLDEFRPSSFFAWRKNPDYYVKGRPFPDRLEIPIIPEYATRMAQFRAGQIWSADVRQEEVLQTKKDQPSLRLGQAGNYPTTPHWIGFGYEGNSPWKDQRMRQAFALLIDRETLTDVFTNRDKFRAAGLEVPIRYHTMVGAGWQGYWLDPQNEKEFGAASKYFKFDPAEAKKLISAAGFSSGVDQPIHYNSGGQYGADYVKVAELYQGMLKEGGINLSLTPHEFSTDWIPNYYYAYAPGNSPGYNGVVWSAELGFPTVALQMFSTMHKDGGRFHGMTPDGSNPRAGDPNINSLIEKMVVEFDRGKQQDLAHDFIRYISEKAYRIPGPYAPASLAFTLDWPVIGSRGAFRTAPGGNAVVESSLNEWIDTSQPPVAKPS